MAERPSARPPAPTAARSPRGLLWIGVFVALALSSLAGLFVALRPFVARRLALAALTRHALNERRFEDGETGLVAELPAGWLALRPGNPSLPAPEARLRLAQPAIAAFATVVVSARPRAMGALDAYLDELAQRRLLQEPSLRRLERAGVQLGRGRGRLMRTAWADGAPMQGATVVWADGYDVFSLEAWAPAAAGPQFGAALAALCRGLRASGRLETRLSQAAERLALEVPELPENALRLLIAERMSQGRDVEGVPADALFLVSRGLGALDAAEAREMRATYQQVWAPLPEAERAHVAALLDAIRAGRELPTSDVARVRGTLKAGVLALAPEQRLRLQQLSDRALRKALVGP